MSEVHTFLDGTDEALGHKFRIWNCDTTKSDVDKRFAIGARLLNKIQKVPRRCPVKFWIIQEPADKGKYENLASNHRIHVTYYPETAVASPQSSGLGTTA
jgi:hypothetical protein